MGCAAKSASQKFTWSNDDTYTLTEAYVASDPMDVSFVEMLYITVRYVPGENNGLPTVMFETDAFDVIKVLPTDMPGDPDDLYWAPYGYYVDGTTGSQDTSTTGIWESQSAQFTYGDATTSGTAVKLATIRIPVASARLIRCLAKESDVTVAGVIEVIATRNSY